MTYAADIWIQTNERKNLTTEMVYWRRYCRITRAYRVTNEEIRRRMEGETIIMEDKVTEWKSLGRRKGGIPRRTWRETSGRIDATYRS